MVTVLLLSHVPTLVTPWTIALQAPLLMGFPRQEYWSGLPFPSPRDLPDPGIKPGSHALQTDLPSETPGFGTLNLVYSWCLINFCCLTQVANNPAEKYIFPKSLAELLEAIGFGSHFWSPHHLLGKMSLLLQNPWPLNSDWPNFVLAPCWSFQSAKSCALPLP